MALDNFLAQRPAYNERKEMLNPFDLKAAIAAKHAQHVVLIHFPIALFIAGVALISWRIGRKGKAWPRLLIAIFWSLRWQPCQR